jgi:hypothetical protein
MEDVIYIDEKNFKDYINLNVIAFSFAHGGAQGSPGEIIVITKENIIYSMNYAYSYMTIEMCDEVCPPLKECQFGFFEVEKTPVGWKGVPLGAGNFLVLSEPIYNQIEHELLQMPPHIRYGRWMGIVKDLMNN